MICMSWLVKPRPGSGKDAEERVVRGVKCVVRVVDGYVTLEAAAKTRDDLVILRRVISSCLDSLLGRGHGG